MSDRQFGELADRIEARRVRMVALKLAGARHSAAVELPAMDDGVDDWQEPMDLSWLAYRAGGMDPRD